MERSERILQYWFGELTGVEDFPVDKNKLWFSKDEATDRIIRDEFEADLIQARDGKLSSWEETSRGSLALITLLDQFSRNMYRDTPEAFAQDAHALQLSLHMQKQGWDQDLYPVERVFVYLPMEHSEDLEMQRKCVRAYERLLETGPPALEVPLGVTLDYAKRHLVIIERFGRFPHRNRILGRESTPEEIEFLKQRGSSF